MANLKPTAANLHRFLAGHDFVWVAIIDVDGVLRGKRVSSKKVLDSFASTGGASGDLNICSGIFGMDIEDNFFSSKLCNSENGFADLITRIDLSSYRKTPWDNNRPFFLMDLIDPTTGKDTYASPRAVLRRAINKAASLGYTAYSGMELEFVSFRMPLRNGINNAEGHTEMIELINSEAVPKVLNRTLQSGNLYCGMGKGTADSEYFNAILRNTSGFECDVEAFHGEHGPGSFEASIAYKEVNESCDRTTLFKHVVKTTGTLAGGIVPTFMAKLTPNRLGQSCHIHMSLVERESGKNVFCRESEDLDAPVPEVRWLSETGRQFLAGVLVALPDMMPMFAPNINSYKRLVPASFAPITPSWALESRQAAIRLITPPTTDRASTRMEIRLAGADCSPHLANAAILAAGLRGIELGLDLFKTDGCPPPLNSKPEGGVGLPLSLASAVDRFRKSKIVRELFGDDFVEHYALTRDFELEQFNKAVTDWELRRYIQQI